jgi:hypothetical protein
MTYQDIHQQGSWQNPFQDLAQWPQWSGNFQYVPRMNSGLNAGLGQAAYGQQSGPFGTGQFGGAWGQRQLSPQDVGEVVRQMLPMLPQILAQSQSPLAAYGYGINQQRQLSPQDINEVVRQLLPVLPQIIGAIQQGQTPMPVAAMYGGYGQSAGWQNFNPYAQAQYNQGFGQFGSPVHAAFGGAQNWGQRQLSPQDVSEVVRQLISAIPQVVGNLQAYGQRLN